MSRKPEKNAARPVRKKRDALAEYLAALEEAYPPAKGKAGIFKKDKYTYIVSIDLPKRVNERMRLYDRMAEVGTDLLLETNKYIILSSR